MFFPQTSPGTDRQALRSISLKLPIALIHMSSQNSPSPATPPQTAIWGRTSDKDQLNIIFTGICSNFQVFFFFLEENKVPKVVFRLGAVTAKERRQKSREQRV